MSSLPRSGPGALFTNTDPFAGVQGESHEPAVHSSADAVGVTQRPEIASCQASDVARFNDMPISAGKANVEDASKNFPSDGAATPALEKLETATKEAGSAVRDKVKSAAQKFKFDSIQEYGVSRFFNPTAARIHVRFRGGSAEQAPDQSLDEKEMAYLWRSRDNRKGRDSIAVPISRTSTVDGSPPARLTSSAREVGQNLVKMFTTFPYWDMAFWSGWSYTIGSALFIIDGLFAWTPVAWPSSEFPGESEYGVALCFFFGALFYQIGAVMAYLEAVNDGSFHGSAMRKFLDGHEEDQKKLLDMKIHSFFGHMVPHRHKNSEEHAERLANAVDPEAGWNTRDVRELRPGSIYPPTKGPAPRRGGIDLGGDEDDGSVSYLTWRWWPTWHALRTHHIYELGYLACAIQLFGVTLYGITAIVVLPGVLSSLNTWQTNAAYWIPQMVAAACFLIASILFTLETQEKWWKPEPRVLGWWIGAWSIVGSVGFELSAAFGPAAASSTKAEYQSDLSTTWGSTAYMIGSALQWYEAINKHPVEELLW